MTATLYEVGQESWSGHGLAITVAKSDASRASLRLVGDVDLCSAALLRAALEYQLGRGRRFVRVDLSGIDLLDSAGLSVFAELHREFLLRRGTMVLTGAGPRIRRLFALLGLHDELLIADAVVRSEVPVA